MAYKILEQGDDAIIKCSKCNRVIVSEYNPFYGPGINITAFIFRKLENHSATYSNASSKHIRATAHK